MARRSASWHLWLTFSLVLLALSWQLPTRAWAACLPGHGVILNGNTPCTTDKDCCEGFCIAGTCCGPEGEGCTCVADQHICGSGCCSKDPNPCNGTDCCSPVSGACDTTNDCCLSGGQGGCVTSTGKSAAGFWNPCPGNSVPGSQNQDCFCCVNDNNNPPKCNTTNDCCDQDAVCQTKTALSGTCCRNVGVVCGGGDCCNAAGAFVGEVCQHNPSTGTNTCCINSGEAVTDYKCVSQNDPNCCSRFCNGTTQQCAQCAKDSDCATGYDCCNGICETNGTCSDPENPNGSPCSLGSDCASGYCNTTSGDCAACTTDAECVSDGTGTTCCGPPPGPLSSTGVCGSSKCPSGDYAPALVDCAAGLIRTSRGLCTNCSTDSQCPSGDKCCGGLCSSASCCPHGETAQGSSDCCSGDSWVSGTCYSPVGTTCNSTTQPGQCLSENCNGSGDGKCDCEVAGQPSLAFSACCGSSCLPNGCTVALGCVGGGCTGQADCCALGSVTCTNANQCCGPNVTSCTAVGSASFCCNTATTASTACAADTECCAPANECALDLPAGSQVCKVAAGYTCTSDSQCATGYAGSCSTSTHKCLTSAAGQHCLHDSDCAAGSECDNFTCVLQVGTGATCSDNADCRSPDICNGLLNFQKVCCVPYGSACSQTGFSCCNGTGGALACGSNNKCCYATGATCTLNTQCCSGSCSGNIVVPGTCN